MSVKHVRAYYAEVCNQYKELRDELQEFQEYAGTHVVSPDTLDNLEKIMAPLMENYERWSYMMFLLNQPNKKAKKKKYEQRLEKFMKTLDKKNSFGGVKEENKQVIEEVHNLRG